MRVAEDRRLLSFIGLVIKLDTSLYYLFCHCGAAGEMKSYVVGVLSRDPSHRFMRLGAPCPPESEINITLTQQGERKEDMGWRRFGLRTITLSTELNVFDSGRGTPACVKSSWLPAAARSLWSSSAGGEEAGSPAVPSSRVCVFRMSWNYPWGLTD